MSRSVEVANILFPDLKPIIPSSGRSDKSFVDDSADGNLEAVIIDLEARGTDKLCIKTLNSVLEKLTAARATLGR